MGFFGKVWHKIDRGILGDIWKANKQMTIGATTAVFGLGKGGASQPPSVPQYLSPPVGQPPAGGLSGPGGSGGSGGLNKQTMLIIGVIGGFILLIVVFGKKIKKLF